MVLHMSLHTWISTDTTLPIVTCRDTDCKASADHRHCVQRSGESWQSHGSQAKWSSVTGSPPLPSCGPVHEM